MSATGNSLQQSFLVHEDALILSINVSLEGVFGEALLRPALVVICVLVNSEDVSGQQVGLLLLSLIPDESLSGVLDTESSSAV